MVLYRLFHRCFPRGAWDPAYAAGVALVVIQVTVGVLYKTAQKDGKYTFSQSGAISISEALKFIIATFFFHREWSRREGSYQVASAVDDDDLEAEAKDLRTHQGSFSDFILACRTELHPSSVFGFTQLAFFYAILNNVVFVLYQIADPGTIQLIKSGITLITALVSLVFLNKAIRKLQWIAIILQISGLVVTQYHPGRGAVYPVITYLLLCFQTFISAVAGVYNESLNKSTGASLHLDNMCLYAVGTAINIVIHVVLHVVKDGEPGFFAGYDNWGAVMVVASNVLVGLAVTAVYKYADSIIKCFATAVSTGILLYISPIIFGTEFGFLILPGTLVVFLATWLYLDGTPPAVVSTLMSPTAGSATGASSAARCTTLRAGWMRLATLGLEAIGTVGIVAALASAPLSTTPVVEVNSTGIVSSPFSNTMAFVRWNSKHMERIPLIKKYEPFFHTVHISIPDLTGTTLAQDGSKNSDEVQLGVADVLEVVLTDAPKIDGMLFFHFDAWIDPMRFHDQNFENIWYPTSTDPKFICHRNETFDVAKSWLWFKDGGYHVRAMESMAKLKELDIGYKFNPTEFCQGWSDIYFIPRRFFRDYIFLARIFNTTFQEAAIPTMLHIIDQTYREDPYTPVLDTLGDCWGDCCKSDPTRRDVTWFRCGHKLSYLNQPVVDVFYNALEDRRKLLGTPRNATQGLLESVLAETGPGDEQP